MGGIVASIFNSLKPSKELLSKVFEIGLDKINDRITQNNKPPIFKKSEFTMPELVMRLGEPTSVVLTMLEDLAQRKEYDKLINQSIMERRTPVPKMPWPEFKEDITLVARTRRVLSKLREEQRTKDIV